MSQGQEDITVPSGTMEFTVVEHRSQQKQWGNEGAGGLQRAKP